jgi:hypothetical protein
MGLFIMTETDKSDTSDVQSHQAQRRQSHTYSLRWLIALLSSPLILAAIGFLTSSVATVWQNKENAKLERAKFEFGMIQEALKTEYMEEATERLKFLLKTEVITQFDTKKLNALIQNHELPIFAGAAIKFHLVSVMEAKQLFKDLGLYDGEINNTIDDPFFKAIADFQYRFNEHGFTVKPGDNLEVDGLLGPKTYAVLKRVMAEKDSNKATILSVKNSSN